MILYTTNSKDIILQVYFSPDNRWLVSAAASDEGSGYLARRVGTWERGFYRPAEAISAPYAEFAGLGKVMAFNLSQNLVSIADSVDGSELIRFNASQGGGTYVAALSEHGEELVLNSAFAPSAWWNLLRVNQQLKSIGLAWNAAGEPSDTAPPANSLSDSWVAQSNSGRPLRLQIDSGDFSTHNKAAIQADALANELRIWRLQSEAGNWGNAWAAFERAMAHSPDNAALINEVSWTVVKPSSGESEQYQRGLELARRLNELVPENGDYLNTLGIALYRNGKWTEAIAALKQSEELSPNRQTSHNAYFLAMSSWHLSDPATALEWYEKAVAWKTGNPSAAARFEIELQQFHEEAASLLKMQ